MEGVFSFPLDSEKMKTAAVLEPQSVVLRPLP